MTDHSKSRFWDNFIRKTETYSISPRAARWYVRHAEQYIKAHADLRLRHHSSHHVEEYLRDKGRSPRLRDWQYRQIVDALRILFVEMVKAPWASEFPWEEWSDSAHTLPDDHASVARDYQSLPGSSDTEDSENDLEDDDAGLYARVVEQHPEAIKAFVAQIRTRHYSIRTEKSYLGWLTRYIAFHSMADPAELSEEHIARFLEHLVVQRKVASSTQGQALSALVFYYKQVLERELNDNIEFAYSRKPRRLPVVLTRSEIQRLFEHVENPTHGLMAGILYGCGLRLMECLRLRVLDIDTGYSQILVRDAKGRKDRRLVPGSDPRQPSPVSPPPQTRARHDPREDERRSGSGYNEQYTEAGGIEKMRYLIIIEKSKTGYSAYSPDLPGCAATGATPEETERSMQEAIQFHLDGLRDEGFPIPEPTSRSSYVEVAA